MSRARNRERKTTRTVSHRPTDRRHHTVSSATISQGAGTASDTAGSRGPTQWRTGWFGWWGLWLPFVFAAAGDVITTWYGVNYAGLTEANVIVVGLGRALGLVPAILVLKTGMLAVFGVAYRYVEPSVRWAVPVFGTVLNTFVVVVNLTGILAS